MNLKLSEKPQFLVLRNHVSEAISPLSNLTNAEGFKNAIILFTGKKGKGGRER